MTDRYAVTCDMTSKGYPRRKVYYVHADSPEIATEMVLADCYRFDDVEHAKVTRVRKIKD